MKTNTPAPRTFRGLPAIALALAALGLSQPAAQAELLTNTWTNASGDFKWNNDDLASVAATPDVNDAVTISYTLPTGSGGKLFARLRVTQK
jgi:hypothetical protein